MLRKVVTEQVHLMRILDAWGIDRKLLAECWRRGVEVVRIVATDVRITEEATLQDFAKHGIRQNFGHGVQIFLPRKFFVRVPMDHGIGFGGGP